jgi:hypothetical protein
MAVSRVVMVHTVSIVARTVAVRCEPRFVQCVLKTTAAFKDERIICMVVALTADCRLAKAICDGQFSRARPLYVVVIANAHAAALHHVHITLGLVLRIATYALQLWYS